MSGVHPFNGKVPENRLLTQKKDLEENLENLAAGRYEIPANDSPTPHARVQIPAPVPIQTAPTEQSRSPAKDTEDVHNAHLPMPEDARPGTSVAQTPQPSTSISPSFHLLELPTVQPIKRRVMLPDKHMSGHRMIASLEAKKKEREELEKAKAERKNVREQKKKEKELKERERLEKKAERERIREERKAEKGRKKQGKSKGKGKGKAKAPKRTRKQKAPKRKDSSDSSDSDIGNEDPIYDDESDFDEFGEMDLAVCSKCGVGDMDTDIATDWIKCDHCPRWWHTKVSCCGDPDIDNFLDELDSYPFMCIYCEC